MAFRLTQHVQASGHNPPPGARGGRALVLCLGTLDIPVANAQSFNPFGWFQQVFRPQRSYDEYRPPRAHPHYTYHPHPMAKVQKAPAVPPSFFVAVLGDSLGQMLGPGADDLVERPA